MHTLDSEDSNPIPRINNQQFFVVRSFLHRTVHTISVQFAASTLKTKLNEDTKYSYSFLQMQLDGKCIVYCGAKLFSLVWFIVPCS